MNSQGRMYCGKCHYSECASKKKVEDKEQMKKEENGEKPSE